MRLAFGRSTWSRALTIVFATQVLFWSAYAVMFLSLRPPSGLEADQLTSTRSTPAPGDGLMGAFVSGLTRAAVLRVAGWQPTVVYPGRVSLLLRSQGTDSATGWSLACLKDPCGKTNPVYAGSFARMEAAARLERFQRHDIVWINITVAAVVGVALLLLLPISRFSRLQAITGIFLLIVATETWISGFGAARLTQSWFPVLRYAAQFLVFAWLALMMNAFAGWRAREAMATAACFLAALATFIAAFLSHVDIASFVRLFQGAALALLFGYAILAALRLFRTTPGLTLRDMALLLVALAFIGFDLFLLLPRQHGLALRSVLLSPPLLVFIFLFELALRGRRLNQEVEAARNDLQRQVLEQDVDLVHSSNLLRRQDRLLAVHEERQRLLRDMHDGAGGLLTHLLLDLRQNRLTPAQIELGLQSAVDDLRNIASAIDADDEPIDEALAAFKERIAARLSRSTIAFTYDCALPAPAPSIDVRRLLSLYRLLQEGVTNVVRHAEASAIDLKVESKGDGVIAITLSDNGKGFDPGRAGSSPGEGRGLANMRRRAEQIGGTLQIDSTPQGGTGLVLTLTV
ncbi:MAG: ATP-binding protein [Alphaproteobacteria bacterium]|nr:ATP-binding protein [Alphaproteobacteria bacterium]